MSEVPGIRSANVTSNSIVSVLGPSLTLRRSWRRTWHVFLFRTRAITGEFIRCTYLFLLSSTLSSDHPAENRR